MKDKSLDNQKAHWENIFLNNQEMFGKTPSYAAIKTVELLKKENKKEILELGGGQGRDTIYFAQNGIHVSVVDYTRAGINDIQEKVQSLGLEQYVTTIYHDIRKPLPFDNTTFDACFSHMFFCMALTTKELININDNIFRVLKNGGLNIYTVRNCKDKHYGEGVHRGEDMYESNGFIVHFFNMDKVELLSNKFEMINVEEFEEGELPRKLYNVILRK